MELIKTNCLNCNSDDSQLYDTENGYNLVKCKKCGLLFVNPRPADNEITAANRSGIHRGEKELNVNNSFNEESIVRYLNIFNDFYTPAELEEKSWLDIGCGNGELLFALLKFTDNKIIVKGSELNQKKIETARKKGLDVGFIDLDKHDSKYDFISLLNVYSHLPNPIETIKNWSKLINESGEILIETGNSSHLSSKFHKKPYYLPDHLSFANKQIIVDILLKSGFKILYTKIYRGVYDPKINIKNISKEFAKLLWGRTHRLYSFFPKYQHGDMYIRAKKL